MRFKDVFAIIGPAMVGPSSSHTAGAVRIGRIARQLMNNRTPVQAIVTLYGSFAETYRGHGTDMAIAGGLLGYNTDHPRIKDAIEDAAVQGMDVRFITSNKPAPHPNTASLQLQTDEYQVNAVGCSIGGGNVEMISIDDFDVKFSGAYPTVVINHHDRAGLIADITSWLHGNQINIGYMDVDRKGRYGEAMTVLELDDGITTEVIVGIGAIAGVSQVRTIDLKRRGHI